MTSRSNLPWLRRRNPAVKLGLLFLVSLATLLVIDPVALFILYVLATAAVRTAALVSWRALLTGQVPFWLFGAGIVAVNVVSRSDGLVIGAAFALRSVVTGVLTIGFLATTPPRDLMASLIEQARVPARPAYAILAGHRMLDVMPSRWATIRSAQAVRSPVRRDGRPRFGPSAFVRVAFALLADSIRSSERIALALESRGLSSRPRTVWRPVPLDRHDVTMILVALIPLVVVIAAVNCR